MCRLRLPPPRRRATKVVCGRVGVRLACLLCCLAPVGEGARALSTDRDQELVIAADRAELDNEKNVVVYRGSVVVTQGSLRMTGETLTVRFDEEGEVELVVVLGEPATYRQLPDGSEVHDEAAARRMEYYARRDHVLLIDKAWVKQDDIRFSGPHIEYDTVSNKALLKGQGAADTGTPGRVRTVIDKRRETE